jgi:hypothetical protein
MNYPLALVLAVVGFSVLLWSRTLSDRFLQFSAHRYSVTFGKLAHDLRWDDPTNPMMVWLHRLLVVILGCFLLLMSFHFFFGTIYTGGATPPPDTILETGN